MLGERFRIAACVLALCACARVQAVMAADLFPPPPERPQEELPEYQPPASAPSVPQGAYILPPPVVIYGFIRPFPYRPYGCGGCGAYPGYPYYIPSANHPPSYYRPYYRHHLGLETDCDECGRYAAPGVSPGWGGYGYK